MRTTRVTLVFVLLNLVIGIASAGLSVAEYKKFKDRDTIKFYVLGIGESYQMANARLMQSKQAPLYCQTGGKLSTEELLDMVNAAIVVYSKRGVVNETTTMQVVVLLALEDMYPCTDAQK